MKSVSIIIQQDATVYSLFISVNSQHVSEDISTHHQELITLHLQYLALMRPLLLPVVNVTGWDTFTTGSSNSLINARYCRYSDMSS